MDIFTVTASAPRISGNVTVFIARKFRIKKLVWDYHTVISICNVFCLITSVIPYV